MRHDDEDWYGDVERLAPEIKATLACIAEVLCVDTLRVFLEPDGADRLSALGLTPAEVLLVFQRLAIDPVDDSVLEIARALHRRRVYAH